MGGLVALPEADTGALCGILAIPVGLCGTLLPFV
jgi:hypothetical protein